MRHKKTQEEGDVTILDTSAGNLPNPWSDDNDNTLSSIKGISEVFCMAQPEYTGLHIWNTLRCGICVCCSQQVDSMDSAEARD
jgi:hypothetical protein